MGLSFPPEAGVQRQHADLAVLAGHGKGVTGQVEVGDVEAEGLPGAYPGGGQSTRSGCGKLAARIFGRKWSAARSSALISSPA